MPAYDTPEPATPAPRPGPAPLTDTLLRDIARHGSTRRFAANSVVVTEDDRTDALFVVIAGRVKAYGSTPDGREVVYATRGPGEYFGEMTLDGGPRSASVMTLEPTTCVVVPGVEVRAYLASQPDFALHLIMKLIALARASIDHVKSLALEDVYGRVVRLLRTLAIDEGGVAVLAEKLTQQDIADRVGSSREMVGRVFKQLTAGGYVALRGGRIFVLKNPPARW